jgi:hypothetical protein
MGKTFRPGYTENNELITSPDLVASAHALMGGIDLDVASSKIANEYVGATQFFTPSDDGLNAQQWHGNAYLFPPNGTYYWDKPNERWKFTRGSSPTLRSSHAVWFKRMYNAWLSKEIKQGLYFTNCPDMIRYDPRIFSFPICILRTAPKLLKVVGDEVKQQPTCTSLVVYLPPVDSSGAAVEKFIDLYAEKGHILS